MKRGKHWCEGVEGHAAAATVPPSKRPKHEAAPGPVDSKQKAAHSPTAADGNAPPACTQNTQGFAMAHQVSMLAHLAASRDSGAQAPPAPAAASTAAVGPITPEVAPTAPLSLLQLSRQAAATAQQHAQHNSTSKPLYRRSKRRAALLMLGEGAEEAAAVTSAPAAVPLGNGPSNCSLDGSAAGLAPQCARQQQEQQKPLSQQPHKTPLATAGGLSLAARRKAQLLMLSLDSTAQPPALTATVQSAEPSEFAAQQQQDVDGQDVCEAARAPADQGVGSLPAVAAGSTGTQHVCAQQPSLQQPNKQAGVSPACPAGAAPQPATTGGGCAAAAGEVPNQTAHGSTPEGCTVEQPEQLVTSTATAAAGQAATEPSCSAQHAGPVEAQPPQQQQQQQHLEAKHRMPHTPDRPQQQQEQQQPMPAAAAAAGVSAHELTGAADRVPAGSSSAVKSTRPPRSHPARRRAALLLQSEGDGRGGSSNINTWDEFQELLVEAYAAAAAPGGDHTSCQQGAPPAQACRTLCSAEGVTGPSSDQQQQRSASVPGVQHRLSSQCPKPWEAAAGPARLPTSSAKPKLGFRSRRLAQLLPPLDSSAAVALSANPISSPPAAVQATVSQRTQHVLQETSPAAAAGPDQAQEQQQEQRQPQDPQQVEPQSAAAGAAAAAAQRTAALCSCCQDGISALKSLSEQVQQQQPQVQQHNLDAAADGTSGGYLDTAQQQLLKSLSSTHPQPQPKQQQQQQPEQQRQLGPFLLGSSQVVPPLLAAKSTPNKRRAALLGLSSPDKAITSVWIDELLSAAAVDAAAVGSGAAGTAAADDDRGASPVTHHAPRAHKQLPAGAAAAAAAAAAATPLRGAKARRLALLLQAPGELGVKAAGSAGLADGAVTSEAAAANKHASSSSGAASAGPTTCDEGQQHQRQDDACCKAPCAAAATLEQHAAATVPDDPLDAPQLQPATHIGGLTAGLQLTPAAEVPPVAAAPAPNSGSHLAGAAAAPGGAVASPAVRAAQGAAKLVLKALPPPDLEASHIPAAASPDAFRHQPHTAADTDVLVCSLLPPCDSNSSGAVPADISSQGDSTCTSSEEEDGSSGLSGSSSGPSNSAPADIDSFQKQTGAEAAAAAACVGDSDNTKAAAGASAEGASWRAADTAAAAAAAALSDSPTLSSDDSSSSEDSSDSGTDTNSTDSSGDSSSHDDSGSSGSDADGSTSSSARDSSDSSSHDPPSSDSQDGSGGPGSSLGCAAGGGGGGCVDGGSGTAEGTSTRTASTVHQLLQAPAGPAFAEPGNRAQLDSSSGSDDSAADTSSEPDHPSSSSPPSSSDSPGDDDRGPQQQEQVSAAAAAAVPAVAADTATPAGKMAAVQATTNSRADRSSSSSDSGSSEGAEASSTSVSTSSSSSSSDDSSTSESSDDSSEAESSADDSSSGSEDCSNSNSTDGNFAPPQAPVGSSPPLPAALQIDTQPAECSPPSPAGCIKAAVPATKGGPATAGYGGLAAAPQAADERAEQVSDTAAVATGTTAAPAAQDVGVPGSNGSGSSGPSGGSSSSGGSSRPNSSKADRSTELDSSSSPSSVGPAAAAAAAAAALEDAAGPGEQANELFDQTADAAVSSEDVDMPDVISATSSSGSEGASRGPQRSEDSRGRSEAAPGEMTAAAAAAQAATATAAAPDACNMEVDSIFGQEHKSTEQQQQQQQDHLQEGARGAPPSEPGFGPGSHTQDKAPAAASMLPAEGSYCAQGLTTAEVAPEQQQQRGAHRQQHAQCTPVLTEQQRVRSRRSSPLTPEHQFQVGLSAAEAAAGGSALHQPTGSQQVVAELLQLVGSFSGATLLPDSAAAVVPGAENVAAGGCDIASQLDQSGASATPAAGHTEPHTPDVLPSASRSLTQQRTAALAGLPPASSCQRQRSRQGPALGSLAQRRAALLMSPGLPQPAAAAAAAATGNVSTTPQKQTRSGSVGSSTDLRGNKVDAWLHFQAAAAASVAAVEMPADVFRDQCYGADTADANGPAALGHEAAEVQPVLADTAGKQALSSSPAVTASRCLTRRSPQAAAGSSKAQLMAPASTINTVGSSCLTSPAPRLHSVVDRALPPSAVKPRRPSPPPDRAAPAAAAAAAADDAERGTVAPAAAGRYIPPAALMGVSRSMVYVRIPGAKQARYASRAKASRQGTTSARSSSSSRRATAVPFGVFPLAPGELPDGAGTCPIKETLEQAMRAAHLDLQLAQAAAEGATWAGCDLAGIPLENFPQQLQAYQDRYQEVRERLMRCRNPADVAKLDKQIKQEWVWLQDVRHNTAAAASQCSKQGILKHKLAAVPHDNVLPGGWVVDRVMRPSPAAAAAAAAAAASNMAETDVVHPKVRFILPEAPV